MRIPPPRRASLENLVVTSPVDHKRSFRLCLRRMYGSGAIVMVALVSAVPRAGAQTSTGLGLAAGVVQLPQSYPGDYTTGLQVAAMLARGRSGVGLGFRLEGALARFPGQAIEDARGAAWTTHRVASLTANAVYGLVRGAARPYVIAGAGYYNQTGYIANHNLGLNAGAGVRLGTGRVGAFVEARLHNAAAVDLSSSRVAPPRIVPLSIGITF